MMQNSRDSRFRSNDSVMIFSHCFATALTTKTFFAGSSSKIDSSSSFTSKTALAAIWNVIAIFVIGLNNSVVYLVSRAYSWAAVSDL